MKAHLLCESEDIVDHTRESEWFNKFCSGYKNLDDQTVSLGLNMWIPKEIQGVAFKANPRSSTQGKPEE